MIMTCRLLGERKRGEEAEGKEEAHEKDEGWKIKDGKGGWLGKA
jgi:hypothetical protein